ncbi:MAG: hypothetical protein HDS07_03125 [Bacteroides sp.]|nr:hypothetical protein [Bacteroides sp.]
MKNLPSRKLLLCALMFTTQLGHAIDYSQYDDGPDFFFGWETSFYFAIATIVLFGISWILSENNKDKNGNVEGNLGCIVAWINVAMIICFLCSFYLMIPIGIIYALIKSKND